VLADCLEKLADEAFGRPVGKADFSAVFADADEFRGGAILVGREHHTEGRHNNVKPGVGERQCFGIRLAEFDIEPFGLGALECALKQGRHIVVGDHVEPRPGGD
jgi:hypothetical protein